MKRHLALAVAYRCGLAAASCNSDLARLLPNQAPKNPHILDIVFQIFFLGSFEDLRNGREFIGSHDLAKGRQSDLSLSDVIMAVDTGTEGRLGIIQVPGRESITSDDSIELFQSVPKPFGRGNIEAGGKEVCSIQASGQTFLEF